MDRHVRIFWGPFKGRVTFNLEWPGVINSKSIVHVAVSAAYLDRPGNSFEDNIRRFPNDALITLHTVSPHETGVTFVVTIESTNYHSLTSDISVLGALPEQYIWAR